MLTDALVLAYAPTFVSRHDDYAVQCENGRYKRVGSSLTLPVLRRHLQGWHTLGTYVIDEEGLCCFAVFDNDMPDGLVVLAALQARLAKDGIPSYLEQSRRGGHLWVLFAARLLASLVRAWLLPYCPVETEFYPKQKQGLRYGSLMRLPLGVHRVTGKRYPFITWSESRGAVPIASSVETMIAWLATCELAAIPSKQSFPRVEYAPMNTHPSKTKNTSTPASDLPTRYTSIKEWCAAQDPFTLIGQYVTLDRRGMGCCPFGEHHTDGKDSNPSFRVYMPSTPGGNCWYCYAWGKGGNVFNFLSMYYRLDARTLWSRILSGKSFS